MAGKTWYQRIPLFGKYLKSDELVNRLSPDNLKLVKEEYNIIVSLDPANNFTDKAADNYLATKEKNRQSFVNSFKPKDRENIDPLVEEALEDVFEVKSDPLANFRAAITDYNSKLATQDSISLVNKFTDAVKDAVKALELQQQAEKKRLEDKFDNNPDFAAATARDSDIEPSAVKEEKLKELEEHHKKQLDDFKDETKDLQIKLHNSTQQKRARLLFIAALYHSNDKNIRELIRQASIGPETRVSEGTAEEKFDPSQVNYEKLLELMNINKQDKTCTIHLGGYLSIFEETNTLAYLSPYQRVQARIDLLAYVMNAEGVKDVTVNVDGFADPEIALERALQVYRAFRLNGNYDAENLTIVVNGKAYKENPDRKKDGEQSFQQLFKNNMAEFEKINKDAKKNKPKNQEIGAATIESKKEINNNRPEKAEPQVDQSSKVAKTN